MALFFTRTSRAKRPAGQRRKTIRLEVERLEDRVVPSGYQQINLVGYQPGLAPQTDPNLNGWGMDYSPGGPFVVADTSPGVATFYDRSGQVLPLVLTIPAASPEPPGPHGPTGVVYNPTSDFVISEDGRSAPAEFLFSRQDGTISGWNPAVDPDHAILMVNNSTEAPVHAFYSALLIAQNSHGQNVLYAADFFHNRIDMFNGGFQSLGSFTDPNVPSQYPGGAAWQVEDVNGQLYVTFTAHKGFAAGGVVDVFDTDGHLLTPNHFAANAPGAGPLEAPWGVVQAPADFGRFSNDILVGNVEGAGNINAFDPATGAFLGPLTHPDGTPIAITGLWDLTFGGNSAANGLSKQLYFDAGPTLANPAGNGLFGMIIAAGKAQGQEDGAGTAAAGRGPLQGIVGLALNASPVTTNVMTSQGALPAISPSPSSASAIPPAAQAYLPQIAFAPPPIATAARTGPTTDALDVLFAQLADEPGDVPWSL